jgi:hypothetical protein
MRHAFWSQLDWHPATRFARRGSSAKRFVAAIRRLIASGGRGARDLFDINLIGLQVLDGQRGIHRQALACAKRAAGRDAQGVGFVQAA